MEPLDIERLMNDGLTDEEMYEVPTDCDQLYQECLRLNEENKQAEDAFILERVEQFLEKNRWR